MKTVAFVASTFLTLFLTSPMTQAQTLDSSYFEREATALREVTSGISSPAEIGLLFPDSDSGRHQLATIRLVLMLAPQILALPESVRPPTRDLERTLEQSIRESLPGLEVSALVHHQQIFITLMVIRTTPSFPGVQFTLSRDFFFECTTLDLQLRHDLSGSAIFGPRAPDGHAVDVELSVVQNENGVAGVPSQQMDEVLTAMGFTLPGAP